MAPDPRPDPRDPDRLYTGEGITFRDALVDNLDLCTHAHLAVSFAMVSGVALLRPALALALQRGARVRLLTSDYLDVTEPEALEMLLALPGIALRAYVEPRRGYHPKAYIFEHGLGHGRAYVGSSNLSRQALSNAVEWNYRIEGGDGGRPLQALVDHYEALWESVHSVVVDAAFVAAYRARRKPRTFVEAERDAVPGPRPAQTEALVQLAALRAEGERKGLVVAATGIGKTFLAAFDSVDFERVLFVAHRAELLQQAHEAFGAVRPAARLGFCMDGRYDLEADVLFASVATLARPEHLARFAPDRFDYLVIDEFHHAAAASYSAILQHFAPKFLLGLTATPYRGDQREVFALCDGNVAYRVDFAEAIALGWLCPFRYYGMFDATTDYSAIPWQHGRYDERALTAAMSTAERAAAARAAFLAYPSRAALGFCVSIAHATAMAASFNEHGIPALAVHTGPGAIDRGMAIGRLRRGEVRILFVVDLFNEGVDIPAIDLILFLRPTESMTIFLQQLGRGLRLYPGKDHVTVLDFIGNYRRAHFKLPLLLGETDVEGNTTRVRQLLQAFTSGEVALPPGCHITLEPQVIDLMHELALRGEPRRQLMREAYDEVKQTLGRRPTMLALHRLGRYDVRSYARESRGWFNYLAEVDDLAPAERTLQDEVGAFLRELETTAMTRSFKMVVLAALLEAGGLAIGIDDLVARFQAYFAASPRHARDLVGADLGEPADPRWRAYLERNPLAAWTGGAAPFFSYDRTAGRFAYIGPSPTDPSAWHVAVAERVDYRLAAYFEARYERRDVFKVMHSEGRGIVMLGKDDRAQVPRDGSWVSVRVDGTAMWAKFAKIAINVLKDHPEDGREMPNRLTATLEGWFGPGGYHSTQENRVRISPAPDEPGVWVIAPIQRKIPPNHGT